MEWQIKIEGQNKKRILVCFDPQGELIIFRGQYSIKNHWIDFSTETHPMEIDLETIQSLIGKVYDSMNKRLEVYDDLNKSFGLIKNIEVQNGELSMTTIVIDNSIYGSPIEGRSDI
jgi:hypothetical protein